MTPQEIIVRVVVEQPSSPPAADDFIEVKGKTYTPSQRLRFALYDKWVASSSTGEFEVWYETQMQRIIDAMNKK